MLEPLFVSVRDHIATCTNAYLMALGPVSQDSTCARISLRTQLIGAENTVEIIPAIIYCIELVSKYIHSLDIALVVTCKNLQTDRKASNICLR